MTIDTSREAVERLLDGVTPGPWRVGPVDDCRVEDADGNEVSQIDGDYNHPDLWPIMEANARFIAAARELVPALLAERDAALAEVARLSHAHAAEKAKLTEVNRELTLTQEAYDAAVEELRKSNADRDEERKLADDLAYSLKAANNYLRLAGYTPYTEATDRHAARRKD